MMLQRMHISMLKCLQSHKPLSVLLQSMHSRTAAPLTHTSYVNQLSHVSLRAKLEACREEVTNTTAALQDLSTRTGERIVQPSSTANGKAGAAKQGSFASQGTAGHAVAAQAEGGRLQSSAASILHNHVSAFADASPDRPPAVAAVSVTSTLCKQDTAAIASPGAAPATAVPASAASAVASAVAASPAATATHSSAGQHAAGMSIGRPATIYAQACVHSSQSTPSPPPNDSKAANRSSQRGKHEVNEMHHPPSETRHSKGLQQLWNCVAHTPLTVPSPHSMTDRRSPDGVMPSHCGSSHIMNQLAVLTDLSQPAECTPQQRMVEPLSGLETLIAKTAEQSERASPLAAESRLASGAADSPARCVSVACLGELDDHPHAGLCSSCEVCIHCMFRVLILESK